MAAGSDTIAEGATPPARGGRGDWQVKLLDRAPFIVACVMLVVLIAVYSSFRADVFSLEELNIDTAAAMTLLLAATGQTIVLLRGGIDLSIGGMISFGTVLAATQFGDSPLTATLWSFAILAIGFARRRHQRADHLRPPPPALPGDARHLVDSLGRGAPRPADRRRLAAGRLDGIRQHLLPRPVELGLDTDRALPLLALVPQHPPRRHHPGDRLQREVRLSLRGFAHLRQRHDLRPLRPLRGARRALPDHPDRSRLADRSARTTSCPR